MSSSFSIHCCNGLNPLIEYHVFRQFSTLILLQFVSNVRWHFFVFRNSGEKLCVSWALPFVECVAVWALKLPVPHTDVLKPTSHKVFLLNYWNTKELTANICHSPTIKFFSEYNPIISHKPQSFSEYNPIVSHKPQSFSEYNPIISHKPQSFSEYNPINFSFQ